MKRIKLILILVACLLLITTTGLAMSSTNYTLNWYHPLTGSGGPSTSTNYAMNMTVGQSVIGPATSTNYKVGLGYWGGLADYRNIIPIISR